MAGATLEPSAAATRFARHPSVRDGVGIGPTLLAFLRDYWLVLAWLSLLLVARVALARLDLPRRRRRVAFAREVCLFVAAYLVYFCVRGLAKDRVALAYAHAATIMDVERRLGIAWERWLQAAVLRENLSINIANWIYVWLFWPLLALVLVWLFDRHGRHYALYRDAILISGAMGLVVFLAFPVAPPRLLADGGFVDTVGDRSVAYQLLLPHALANFYAAMPSLHAGWVLVAGVAVARHARELRWRLMGGALPLLMFLSIVGTANHYLLDGMVGWLFAAIGLGLATLLGRLRAHPRLTRRPIETDSLRSATPSRL